MRERWESLLGVALLGVLAACASHDERPSADTNAESKPKVVIVPARGDTVPASAETLGPGDVRIVTTDGSVDLALIGDTITSGLSARSLQKVRQETDTAKVTGSGFGAQIEKLVKEKVQGAIGTRVGFPISEVREVRYDGEKLVFEWNGKPPKLFDNTKIDGKPLLASFSPDDAKRFAAAVNARKGVKPKNL